MSLPVVKQSHTYEDWFAAVRAELAKRGRGWERYSREIRPDDSCWLDAYNRGDSAEETADYEVDAAGC